MSELDEIEKKSISASEMTDVEYCIYFVAQQGMLSRENAKDAAKEYANDKKVMAGLISAVEARDKQLAALRAQLDRAEKQIAAAQEAMTKIETKCLSKDNMKRTIRAVNAIAFNYLNAHPEG